MDETAVIFLRETIRLAWQGLGVNSPNPLVGCVIVKDGDVIGRGVHIYENLDHAEVAALKDAGDAARDATLYVNMEPCNHHGRTPPCTEAILAAGISRVVYGIDDPNPDVKGGGALHLASNGVFVEKCNDIALIKQAEEQNKFFLTQKRLRRPYITVKAAMSLDGCIATKRGHSKWITNEHSLAVAHLLRGIYDGILIGRRTALEDNPALTYRPEVRGAVQMPEFLFPYTSPKLSSPARIVIDPDLSLPPGLKLFDIEPEPTIVATSEASPEKSASALAAKGVEVLRVPGEGGVLDLNALMSALSGKGMLSLLVEGGGETSGRFFDARLVDEINYFIAPIIIGGRDAVPVVGGEGPERLLDVLKLSDVRTGMLGRDMLIVGRILDDAFVDKFDANIDEYLRNAGK